MLVYKECPEFNHDPTCFSLFKTFQGIIMEIPNLRKVLYEIKRSSSYIHSVFLVYSINLAYVIISKSKAYDKINLPT